jgi:hypothetical protein
MAIKVLLVVEAIVDLMALLVEFTRPGAIAFDIYIQMHFDDLVRRQKAVADALLERVGVDRRAKVMHVGNVGRFPGRGGEADLRGTGKILQDLAPGRVLGGAAAVTLVDDDQIEKAGRKLAEELLPLFRAGDGLI